MHFQRSKSTLDSLKRVFNVFRRKPSLGDPDESSVKKLRLSVNSKCLKTRQTKEQRYIYSNFQQKVLATTYFNFCPFTMAQCVFFLSENCIDILTYVTLFTIKPLGYYNITNRVPTHHASNKQMLIYFQFCFQLILIYVPLTVQWKFDLFHICQSTSIGDCKLTSST